MGAYYVSDSDRHWNYITEQNRQNCLSVRDRQQYKRMGSMSEDDKCYGGRPRQW